MTINEAITKVKESSREKFDASIEVHVNCVLDKEKQETVRLGVLLPHGTGKSKKIAVMASGKLAEADLELTEDDIKSIETGKMKPKVDFDVLVVEPRFMAKLAKVAKILGPAGLMPNPKNGTVTEDVKKAVAQFKKGRTDVRNEANGSVIHTVIGKRSFTDQALTENFQELISALRSGKAQKVGQDWIKSVYICSSMGPSFEVAL